MTPAAKVTLLLTCTGLAACASSAAALLVVLWLDVTEAQR